METASNIGCPQEAFVDKIINSLECPVCFVIPQTQVYMCTNGHNVCVACKTLINNKCPLCREVSEWRRNIAIEAVVTEYTNFSNDSNSKCFKEQLIEENNMIISDILDDSRNEIADYKIKLAAKNTENEEYKKKLSECILTNKMYEEEKSKHEEDMVNFEEKIDACNVEIEKLRGKNDELEERISKHIEEQIKRNRELLVLEKLKFKIDQHRIEIGNYDKKIDEHRKEISKLTKELDVCNVEIEKFRKEKGEHEEEISKYIKEQRIIYVLFMKMYTNINQRFKFLFLVKRDKQILQYSELFAKQMLEIKNFDKKTKKFLEVKNEIGICKKEIENYQKQNDLKLEINEKEKVKHREDILNYEQKLGARDQKILKNALLIDTYSKIIFIYRKTISTCKDNKDADFSKSIIEILDAWKTYNEICKNEKDEYWLEIEKYKMEKGEHEEEILMYKNELDARANTISEHELIIDELILKNEQYSDVIEQLMGKIKKYNEELEKYKTSVATTSTCNTQKDKSSGTFPNQRK